jgi:hypothetical protein
MAIPEIVSVEAVTTPATKLIANAQTDLGLHGLLLDRDHARQRVAEDIRLLQALAPHLPQLPDADVHDVYERVVEAEATAVGPKRQLNDYSGGTATHDDELRIVDQGTGNLLEAQHATDPVRKDSGKREAADHGTGGLGLVLAEDAGGRIIVPLGRQTGNANTDAKHPIKDELLAAAATGAYDQFFSVHGMRPGKVLDLRDVSEIHAVIGLGLNPTEADFERAERLLGRAYAEYGLRLVIGNRIPHLNFQKADDWDGTSFRDWTHEPQRRPDGAIGATRVAALMPTSTVTFMREQTGLSSSQLEISRSLRLMPRDMYRRPDRKAEAYGVYLGYQLCRLALETR